jgi:hypothetical protein
VRHVVCIALDRTLVWSRLYCADKLSALRSFINRFIDLFINNEKCVVFTVCYYVDSAVKCGISILHRITSPNCVLSV